MQSPSETAGETGSDIRSDAQHLSTSAANRLHKEIDARKGTAASQAKSVSSAIDRTAGELDDSAPEWLRSAFRQGAQRVQRFADALEHKDSRQIVDELRTFARDHPGTFLAGCAAAGFAAARVFKAGADGEPERATGQFRAPPAPMDEPTLGSASERPSTVPPSARGEFA